MYTGAPVGLFSYLLLTRLNRKHIRPMRDLGASRDEITGHNTDISLLLSTSARALLDPPIELRETRETRTTA